MTSAFAAATLTLDAVLLPMLGAYRPRGSAPARPESLPLQPVRRPAGGEMADVDALGPTHPNPLRQRLVDVTEQCQPGLCLPDRLQQHLAAALQPAGHRVVEQFGNGRRDMRT